MIRPPEDAMLTVLMEHEEVGNQTTTLTHDRRQDMLPMPEAFLKIALLQ